MAIGHREQVQVQRILSLLQQVLGEIYIGVYLFGSAAVSSLKPSSDLDILAVTRRSLNSSERSALVEGMLGISGEVAQISQARPVEMTVVTESIAKPWRHPPKLEFLYGEWLRDAFASRKPPRYPIASADLTTVMAMAIQKNVVLYGPPLKSIIDRIPEQDVLQSMIDGIPELLNDLDWDARNVLLTFTRIWYTLVNKEFTSKDEAALWVRNQLPEECHTVLDQAVSSYLGIPEDLKPEFIQHTRCCIDYMVSQIQQIGNSE